MCCVRRWRGYETGSVGGGRRRLSGKTLDAMDGRAQETTCLDYMFFLISYHLSSRTLSHPFRTWTVKLRRPWQVLAYPSPANTDWTLFAAGSFVSDPVAVLFYASIQRLWRVWSTERKLVLLRHLALRRQAELWKQAQQHLPLQELWKKEEEAAARQRRDRENKKRGHAERQRNRKRLWYGNSHQQHVPTLKILRTSTFIYIFLQEPPGRPLDRYFLRQGHVLFRRVTAFVCGAPGWVRNESYDAKPSLFFMCVWKMGYATKTKLSIFLDRVIRTI